MKKIITKSWIEETGKFKDEEAINEKLHSSSDFMRSNAAIYIGLHLQSNYLRLSRILLNEMEKDVHFENVRLGIKSAWTIALVLAENLNASEYSHLKTAFSNWPKEERDGLLNWLKDYPEQKSILLNGVIN